MNGAIILITDQTRLNSTVDDLSMTGPQCAENKVRLNSEIQT